jgi:hypothetical protein
MADSDGNKEPGPTDNPRDYGKYPASLSEKAAGLLHVYGQLGSDFVDMAKKAMKKKDDQ